MRWRRGSTRTAPTIESDLKNDFEGDPAYDQDSTINQGFDLDHDPHPDLNPDADHDLAATDHIISPNTAPDLDPSRWLLVGVEDKRVWV